MSCRHDVPATTVARMMATHHIHSVVVEGAHDDPVHGERPKWGVVSDMDLLRGARAAIDDMTRVTSRSPNPSPSKRRCRSTRRCA